MYAIIFAVIFIFFIGYCCILGAGEDECDICNGTGYINRKTCIYCNGTGEE